MPPDTGRPDGALLLGPLGETPDYWEPVLARTGVRTVVHRRSGLADLDDELPLAWRAASDAGITSPLVVGASLGGVLGRRLAAERPVAGLVLLDSSLEDFPGDLVLPEAVSSVLRRELTDNEEGVDVLTAHARLRRDRRPGMYGELPLWVVARGRNDWPTEPDAAAALQRRWIRCQRSLTALSERARFVRAEGSGHHIALDRPDLVATLVDEAVLT